MLKKLISVFLVLTILCSLTAVAAVPEGLSGTVYEEALLMLDELELASQKFISGFKPNKSIKRSEFASLLCSYLGYDKTGGISASEASGFADINEYDDNYISVLTVSKYGIMSGDGYGNFNPGDTVTYAQVIKVIMSVLGYGEYAMAYGGYPQGYIAVADNADILDNVSVDDFNSDAKLGNIVIMLANALETKVLEYESVGDDGVTFSTDSDRTILNIYHHLESYTGRVNGVYGKQLMNVSPLCEDEILIGSNLYKLTAGKSYEEFFGFDVTFYCDSESKVVKAVTSQNNNVIKVKSEDVAAYDNNVIRYFDGDKEKKIRLDIETDIVYNGRLHSSFTPSDLTSAGTSIDFIDAGADGVVDVVSITHIKNYVVKSVNVSERIVYDMYGRGNLYADNTDVLIFKDQLGNDMGFEELSQYDVLSVVQSKDGLLTTITFSNRETEGTVEAINSADGTIVIDGYTYYTDADFAAQHSVELGQNGLFPLDINGNIAAYKPYHSSYKLAYVMGAYTSNDMHNETFVKLLTEDNKIEIFKVSDKLIGDGNHLDGSGTIGLLSENGSIKPQIIRYYLTKGEIRAIDTMKTSGGGINDSLELMYSGSLLRYNRYQAILGAKVPLSDATSVFVVPSDADYEDGYSVYSKSAFSHDHSYDVDAYTVNMGGHIADAVVIVGGISEISSSTPVFLVESVSRVTDENGDSTARIYGYSGGKYVSYLTKDESIVDNLRSISDPSYTHALGCGDVVKLGFDGVTGRVKEIELYYEKSSDFIQNDMQVGSNLSDSNRMLRANVYSNSDGIVRLTQNSLQSADIKLTLDETETIAPNTYDIYVYTIENGKPTVSIGTTTDRIDYCSSETDFSKVLMFSAYSDPGTLIIYND